jgi:hypothetical protein
VDGNVIKSYITTMSDAAHQGEGHSLPRTRKPPIGPRDFSSSGASSRRARTAPITRMITSGMGLVNCM